MFFHGENWKEKVGPNGFSGALLIARTMLDIQAFVDAHRTES